MKYIAPFLFIIHIAYSCGISSKPCSFKVLSVDHVVGDQFGGDYGQYFNFDVLEVDRLLGYTNWHDTTFRLYNSRTKEAYTVRLWRTSNGGSIGNGHGRKEHSPKAGNWRIG
eukprot:373673_1